MKLSIERQFLLLSVVLIFLLNTAFASHEFVNNVPDSRCKKRGQYLTHPHDRCKYVVCEFGSGQNGYVKEKMYARAMPCAPGTAVPYSAYHDSTHGISGVPCTNHYSGTCPASLGGRYVLHSSSNHGRHHTGNRFYGKSITRHRPINVVRYRPRTALYRRKAGGYSRRTDTYARPQRKVNDAPHVTPQLTYASNKHDGRCKKVGQFFTHPTDRCSYVVCEFGSNTLTSGTAYEANKLYARIMPCAPGTAVSNGKYQSGDYSLGASPCTQFYDGRCPARPSAYHPLGNGSQTSYRPPNYRYY